MTYNTAPFDLVGSESELISGFLTEYNSIEFIFMLYFYALFLFILFFLNTAFYYSGED